MATKDVYVVKKVSVATEWCVSLLSKGSKVPILFYKALFFY